MLEFPTGNDTHLHGRNKDAKFVGTGMGNILAKVYVLVCQKVLAMRNCALMVKP